MCDRDFWFFVGVFWFLGLGAGCSLGGALFVNPLKRDAIKAGVAEYRVIDPATGKTEFRFIPCEAR